MAIAGLTNKDRDFNSLGRVEVKVFKGTRKIPGVKDGKEYEGYGSDLGSKLRISTENKSIRRILKPSYGSPDGNGDFLAEELRIYFPFDEVERTFVTRMASYKGSGLEVECDRTNILQKCVMLRDSKGEHRTLVDCKDTPCPMRGKSLSMECQHGCKAEGNFFFYIRELLDNDLMIPGRISLHSLEDVSYVDDKLREFKEELGSITNSSFPCHWYRHKIPFILSRTQVKIKTPLIDKTSKMRTGKKSDRLIWAISLQVDPEYMELRRAWMELEERTRRQLPVSQSVVKGLLRGEVGVINNIDAIDVEVVETKMLPPADEVYKQWKDPEDAIAWAAKKLPLVSEDRLWQEFDNLKPVNGKKAPAWFSLIESAVGEQKNGH